MSRIMKLAAVIVTVQLIICVASPFAPASSSRSPDAIRSDDESGQIAISDVNFTSVAQQIKDLSNPTFRAFLRLRILGWLPPEANAERRQAALAVAREGLSDLCAHQDDIWPATASWLYEGFIKSVKGLEPPDTVSEKCSLKKDDKTSEAAKDLAAAIKMLNDPATAATGTQMAKQAILSGQVPAPILLGQLLRLQSSNSPAWPDLLSATLSVAEQQPGVIPLQLMGFFSPLFLKQSNPTEVRTRFLSVAVRATRLSPEDSSNPLLRGPMLELLSGILQPTSLLAPALYPEVAGRLSSLSPAATHNNLERQAVEERINKSSDPLEQTISEADRTTDKSFKRQLLDRAARIASTQGKLRQAVDLAVKASEDSEDTKYSPLDQFLGKVVQAAIKQKEPDSGAYAVSKMRKALNKAKGLCVLGEYYAELKDTVKTKQAFTESANQLKRADNDNEKVKLCLAVAESMLKHDPLGGYDVFRQAVDAINKLPSPEKEQEKRYYLSLLPIAEDLITSFRLFAGKDGQSALALARDIKLSELRVSALSGAYSTARIGPPQKVTKN